jgi:Zn-dependent protease with chaperone function
MSGDKNKAIKFSTFTDKLKLGGFMALSYMPLACFEFLTSSGFAETGIRLAIASTAIPYAYAVPKIASGLKDIFNKKNTLDYKHEQTDFVKEEFCKLRVKARINKDIKIKFTNKSGARASINQLQISRTLPEKLNKGELRYILAHELSHIKNRDMQWCYSLYPAMGYIVGLAFFPTSILSGNMILACLLGNMYYQETILNAMSRHQEARADRNALNLTGDFNSAVKSLAKLTSYEILKKPSLFCTIFSKHPRGLNRIRKMEKHFHGNGATPFSDAIETAEEMEKVFIYKLVTKGPGLKSAENKTENSRDSSARYSPV